MSFITNIDDVKNKIDIIWSDNTLGFIEQMILCFSHLSRSVDDSIRVEANELIQQQLFIILSLEMESERVKVLDLNKARKNKNENTYSIKVIKSDKTVLYIKFMQPTVVKKFVSKCCNLYNITEEELKNRYITSTINKPIKAIFELFKRDDNITQDIINKLIHECETNE